MATRTSLDKPSPFYDFLSLSDLPNLGSLTITDVSSAAQQGAQKSSNEMQDLQRQQTQPTIVPPLTPPRVNTSVADDLDDLLSATLQEFLASSSSSSSSSAQLQELLSSSSSSSSSSVQSAALSSFDFPTMELDFNGIEDLLCNIFAFPFAELSVPSNFKDDLAKTAINDGQLANHVIGCINQFFISLLAHSANPESWLESESKTPFFCNAHPFGTSCFLMTTLDKATTILPHLDQKLLADWKDNYQKCVLILKKSGLDRYNETELPFSAENKQIMSKLQMQSGQHQTPQAADFMQQAMSYFAQNPDRLQQEMSALAQNPDRLQQLMSALAQNPEGMLNLLGIKNPRLAEWLGGMLKDSQTTDLMQQQVSAFAKDAKGTLSQLRAQIGTLGPAPDAKTQLNEPKIQSMLAFFKELDQVLQRHPKNAGDVEVWLKAEGAKSTYEHPFLCFKALEPHLSEITLTEKDLTLITPIKVLYESCCERLIALGLQSYIDEPPSKQVFDTVRQLAITQKEACQDALSKSVSFLKPLSEELKKLKLIPEAREANHQTIEDWITNCKAAGTYFPPFVVGQVMFEYMPAFEGILDGEQLQELNVLYPFCRDQLLALGLKTYLTEMPPDTCTTTASTTAATSTPKKNLSDTERFIREIAFFREMLQQKDEAVEEWLKDNSPKLDYPLLWAKKRMSQLSHFRDTVDIDLRRDWRMCSDACLEKIEGPALKHHMDIANIPADASAELRAYLT